MRGTLGILLIKFLVGALGIILISAIPSMFMDGYHLAWSVYWDTVKTIFGHLAHANDMVYQMRAGIKMSRFDVFPDYWLYFGYSFTIFGAAFGISLFAGLFFTYMTGLLPKKVVKMIVSILSFLESIPDLLIIAFFVFMVIFIYQHTGVLLFNIAGAFEHSYFIPIVSLTILPSILFFKILLLAVTDEENELYVDLAKSKGINKSRVILVHIYRNAIITLCTHLKSILFILLSNLVIVEYIFNIEGITRYIQDHPQPDIFALSILLFFVPVYLIMAVIRLYAEHLTGRRVAV
jgi:peptide/nickel transport system permease protein